MSFFRSKWLGSVTLDQLAKRYTRRTYSGRTSKGLAVTGYVIDCPDGLKLQTFEINNFRVWLVSGFMEERIGDDAICNLTLWEDGTILNSFADGYNQGNASEYSEWNFFYKLGSQSGRAFKIVGRRVTGGENEPVSLRFTVVTY